MADLMLEAKPLLGGLDIEIGGTRLRECPALALVAIATPLGGEDALKAAIKAAYGCALPTPQKSILSQSQKTRLISTQPDQLFVAFDHPDATAEAIVSKAIGTAGYVTDQTDGWVRLALSGPLARTALERLSMVDLGEEAFPLHASARTSLEHMGALIVRTGDDSFLLASASSSAHSFAHALEQSLHNVS